MSSARRASQMASVDARGQRRAAKDIRRRCGHPSADMGVDAPLRLLPGKTRPMSCEREQRLVVSLGELIVELVEADPHWLEGLKASRRCDLDGCSRAAKEQS